jgi:hypothetical protein
MLAKLPTFNHKKSELLDVVFGHTNHSLNIHVCNLVEHQRFTTSLPSLQPGCNNAEKNK